jgi:hypothetical protein
LSRALLLLASALALSGCAGSTFRLSAGELRDAENDAIQIEMAAAAAAGLSGTWLPAMWGGATCRWSRTVEKVAICKARTRRSASQTWSNVTLKYRQDDDGRWRVVD